MFPRTFALLGGAFLLVLGAIWIFGSPALLSSYSPDRIAGLPFAKGSELPTNEGESVGSETSTRRRAPGYKTYQAHGATIIDIGAVRIAIEGWKTSGVGSGSIVLYAEEESWMGEVTTSGTGDGRFYFATRHEAGTTTCTASSYKHGDISFEIRQGILTVDSRSIAMSDGQQVIYLNSEGEVQEIRRVNDSRPEGLSPQSGSDG